MKNKSEFLSENFQFSFWVVKVSIYLNRHVFVMFHILREMGQVGQVGHCISTALSVWFLVFHCSLF